jgi:hypothetical protein
MKTTLDLPDDLVHRIKIRAVHERKPLKRVVADLLARSLDAPAPSPAPSGTGSDRIVIGLNGLPQIVCGPNAPVERMTVDEIVKKEHEILSALDLEHAGLSR